MAAPFVGMDMSESDEVAAEEPAGRADIWIEKYRPKRLEDVVGHDDIIPRLQSYVDRDDLPNLLFSGPAGTGKCVSGETPIMTSDGLQRIDAIVGDVDGFSPAPPGLEVLTLGEDGQFRYTAPSHVFGRETDEVVRVRTADGGRHMVTPEHPFLVLGHDGFRWDPAEELDAGDRVVRPVTIPTDRKTTAIDWYDRMDPERTLVHVTESFAANHDIQFEAQFVGDRKRVFGHVREGQSFEEIVERTGCDREIARQHFRDAERAELGKPSTECSLRFLRMLPASRQDLRENVLAIRHVDQSAPMLPKWELTPKLAAFLGMTVGGATAESAGLTFVDDSEDLVNRYATLLRDLFDIEATLEDAEASVHVENNTLDAFIEACFGGFDGEEIISSVAHGDEGIRKAFLRAVFDATAHVEEDGYIELSRPDGAFITQLSYLLATCGIPSSRTRQQTPDMEGSGTGQTDHILRISGFAQLSRFAEHIGFDHPEKSAALRRVLDRPRNPPHDTIPEQHAADRLCERCAIDSDHHARDSLQPVSFDRRAYLDDLDTVVDRAAKRLEVAQQSMAYLEDCEGILEDAIERPTIGGTGPGELQPVNRNEDSSTATMMYQRPIDTTRGGQSGRHVRDMCVGLESTGTHRDTDALEIVRPELRRIVSAVGVEYDRLATGTDHRGSDLENAVTTNDHHDESRSSLLTLAQRLEEVVNDMVCLETLADLSHLDVLTKGTMYFDEVESVERVEGTRRVYDLTVPGTRNYVAGSVPTVMHNTTAAQAIARELFADEWRENFLELNASDDRGIDVVRGRIKDFARASFGAADYRIIFLDEADSLTSDAQSALRRTMEQFSHNTRFILSCNYSSKIIDPIQSRCAVFRFTGIGEDAIAERVREIADAEGIEITEDGVEAVVYAANGDMRKAINALQAAAVLDDTVDESTVYTLTSTARPEVVERMITNATEGDFLAARSVLTEMLDDAGLAGGDVIDQLHRSVWDFGLDERAAVDLLERLGEADYRISEGANERIQLEALLASIARNHSE